MKRGNRPARRPLRPALIGFFVEERTGRADYSYCRYGAQCAPSAALAEGGLDWYDES
jgi:hypothetical protein